MNRVRIFVDFWNFHLGVMQSSILPVVVDWRQFGLRAAQALTRIEYAHLGGDIRHDGTHVYGSFATSKPHEISLADEFTDEIALIAGMFPVFEERKKRPAEVKCDHCGEDVSLFPEQGIDVRLAVDVVKFSSFQPDAIIVLATNDGDFIPLAEYLTGIGRKVVHLHPWNANRKLSQKCWASLGFEKLDRGAFPFKPESVLVRIPNTDGYQDLREALNRKGLHYREVDLIKSKTLKADLFRIFADNQRYDSNFSDEFRGSIRSIDEAIDIASKDLNRLRGPFLLYDKQIRNRAGIEAVAA